jgi:hypothetical protein
MRFLAVGAASELPHDHEALALFARTLKVIAQVEKALQEPRLLVETIVR